MPPFKPPIREYSIEGEYALSGGGFNVTLLLRMASSEQVNALENFLKEQGWLK